MKSRVIVYLALLILIVGGGFFWNRAALYSRVVELGYSPNDILLLSFLKQNEVSLSQFSSDPEIRENYERHVAQALENHHAASHGQIKLDIDGPRPTTRSSGRGPQSGPRR